MSAIGSADFFLPSRGVLYGGKVPEGKVVIRDMTAKEHLLLAEAGGGILGKLSAVLNACVQLPEGSVKLSNLLVPDRMALLLALRTRTFGPKYTMSWKCPECEARNKSEIDIARDLNERTPKEGLVEPFEVTLPHGKNVVSLRFLRGDDEETVMRSAKSMQAQSTDGLDKSMLIRVALQIVAIDGAEQANTLVKLSFVERLHSADLFAIQDAIEAVEPGIDTSVHLTCPKCEADSKLQMSFTPEFFRPRVRN